MNLQQRARPAPEVIFQEVAGETVLLDLSSEHYFGLDETGTRVWELIQQDGRLQTVVETMLAEFEVEREQLEQDLAALLGEMLEAGLIILEPV